MQDVFLMRLFPRASFWNEQFIAYKVFMEQVLFQQIYDLKMELYKNVPILSSPKPQDF